MIRRPLFLALGAWALVGLANHASAQIIGGLPQLQKGQLQQMKLLEQQLKLLNQDAFKQLQLDPELLKQLQLDPDALQQLQLNRQGGAAGGGQLAWAGMRLKKPTAAEQQNLGLPENEGLVITSVAANSAGEKAGLKANDILIKINKKAVPNDHPGFAKFLKDNEAADAMEIVVLREGKEEKLNAGKMPLAVQTIGAGGGINGGALQIRPGIGIGGLLPKLMINPRVPGAGLPNVNPNPKQNPPPPPQPDPKPELIPGNVQNLSLSRSVNGITMKRKQHNEDFSGEYIKGDLHIAIAGKIENGVAKATEITITEKGKDAKKYTSIHDVPGQYRSPIQQIMPTANTNGFRSPLAPLDPNQKREL